MSEDPVDRIRKRLEPLRVWPGEKAPKSAVNDFMICAPADMDYLLAERYRYKQWWTDGSLLIEQWMNETKRVEAENAKLRAKLAAVEAVSDQRWEWKDGIELSGELRAALAENP